MSELRTNKIYPRDGLPAGASGGGIVQVVNSVFDDRYETSSHTTFTDTGLTATITPTSSSNKILLLISVGGVAARLGNLHQEPDLRVVRGATTVATFSNIIKEGGTNFWIPKDGDTARFTKTIIDTPATTSSVTYKIQIRGNTSTSGTMSVAINSIGGGSYEGETGGGGSSICLMEVSG